jgi:predicted HicB family RNase H-like nuclease
LCQERGEKPEKTFSGTFNLRINPDLHAKLSIRAKALGLSLNSYVAEKLKQ